LQCSKRRLFMTSWSVAACDAAHSAVGRSKKGKRGPTEAQEPDTEKVQKKDVTPVRLERKGDEQGSRHREEGYDSLRTHACKHIHWTSTK